MKGIVITQCRLWLICLLASISVHVKGENTLEGLSDADWFALQELYYATNGANWTNTWTLGATAAETGALTGVSISNGHVTSINLSNNNLQGEIPASLFKLPALTSINLSSNQVTGDLTALFNNENMPVNSVITSLNLSHNQLTGNMYYLTLKLSALTTLNLNDNRIRDCYPEPPRYISDLNVKGQDLSNYMVDDEGHPIALSTLLAMAGSDAESTDLLPTIMLLKSNSSSYSYNTDISIGLYNDWNFTWRAKLVWRRNGVKNASVYGYGYNFDSWGAHTYYGANDTYRGELNDGIYAFQGWYDNYGTNSVTNFHRFPLILDTPYGDLDFSCSVTLSDMQNLIYSVVEGYLYSPYIAKNFTAANIISTDNVINIQDVVACINILLDKNITPSLNNLSRDMYRRAAQQATAEATLAIDSQGRLVLCSAVPVAALELQLDDGDVQWQEALSDFGHANRKGHHIFYSLLGDELPAGTTVLATTTATLLAADAVNKEGRSIPLSIDQGVTRVNTVVNNKSDGGNCFDLQGRLVSKGQLRSGIYVKDGKKVIVK